MKLSYKNVLKIFFPIIQGQSALKSLQTNINSLKSQQHLKTTGRCDITQKLLTFFNSLDLIIYLKLQKMFSWYLQKILTFFVLFWIEKK